MTRLSAFAQHLARYDADAIVLTSNEPIVLRFAQGDRKATQTVDHQQLMAIVQDVAPRDALVALRASRPAKFGLDEQGVAVQVEVIPGATSWRVVLSRASASVLASTHTTEPSMSRDAAASRVGRAAPVSTHEARPTATTRESFGRMPSAPAASASADGWGPASGSSRASRGGVSALDGWLTAMARAGASDLHLTTTQKPLVRLHGEIKALDENDAPLTSEGLREAIFATMPEKNRDELDRRHDTDWAYEIAGVARFRGNAFVDRFGVGAVFRRIPYEILSPEALGISSKVLDLCNLTKGLVLVTGPTGSGKSTTLATLIDHVNATRDDHIITIEDPIEFVHNNKRCLINQREIGTHTESFKNALRAALREDPDVVLVGEMRDLETIAIAIETAETGHLVFGTLHTTTAPGAVDRIIDQFPADRQAQIRTMLSESLKGVIAQVLCKKKGGGRAAAYEVLIGIPAVANLIREGKTFQIPSAMQTNRAIGMITMGDSLLDLVKRDIVEPKEAYMKAVNKVEMRHLLTQAGFSLDALG